MADDGTYRSRVAAAALEVFAGGFGAHRLFLGQWWGVFYLLFFWTYPPFIVGLIEGIVFLASDQDSWNRKYNHGVSAGREPVLVVAIFAIALPAIEALGKNSDRLISRSKPALYLGLLVQAPSRAQL